MTARPPVVLPDVEAAQAKVDELILAAGEGHRVAELDLAKALAGVELAGRYDEAAARVAATKAEEARRGRVDAALSRLRVEAPIAAEGLLEARREALRALSALIVAAERYSTLVGSTAAVLAADGPLPAHVAAKIAHARRFDLEAPKVRPHGPHPDGVDVRHGGVVDGPVFWPCPAELAAWVAGAVLAAAVGQMRPSGDLHRRLLRVVPAAAHLERLQGAVDAARAGGSVEPPTAGPGGTMPPDGGEG